MLEIFTQHAMARMRQRGKSAEGVKLILRHGVRRAGVDGVLLRRRDANNEIERRKRWLARISVKKWRWRKALQRRIDILERMIGCVVVEKDGRVITVYNRRHRFGRTRRVRKTSWRGGWGR